MQATLPALSSETCDVIGSYITTSDKITCLNLSWQHMPVDAPSRDNVYYLRGTTFLAQTVIISVDIGPC